MRYLLLAIIMLLPATADAGFLYLDYSPPEPGSVYWFDYWGLPRHSDATPVTPQAEPEKVMPEAPTPTVKPTKKKAGKIIVVIRRRVKAAPALPDPPVVVPDAPEDSYLPIEEVEEPEHPEMPDIYYVHIFGEGRGYPYNVQQKTTHAVLVPEPSTWILLLCAVPVLVWRKK